MAANWHYAKGGKKHGPITAAQLKELATTGQLSPDDLVWREDMKEWRKAATVKGLFPTQPAFPSSPPPVPSSPKKKSRKLLWLGVASVLVVGAVASWQLIFRQMASDDNEQSRTANDSRLDSGVGDQTATNTPESAPATSEASVVYLNGMDFGERPEITSEAALTFRGRIFLPGGVRTHGEIRDARYCFSPDSQTIFMGANGRGAEHPIYAFDNRTGTLLSHIPRAHPRVNAGGDSTLNIAISPDGRFIATGCGAGRIKVWNAENIRTGTASSLHEWSLADPQSSVLFGGFSFAFSDDSTFLYFHVGSHLGCCNISTGDMLFHDTAEMRIRGYNEASDTFWAIAETGTVHQWEAKTGTALEPKDFIHRPYRCQGCVQSGDGSRFFVLLMNAPDDDTRNVTGFECRVVDHNFAVLNTIALPERPLAIGASHDGERCAFSYGTRFTIHETNSGREVASVRNLYGKVSHFAFSPDGKRLLTSAFTQGLYVFDFEQAR